MGDVYYAEGEYLHDVRALALSTPWRRHWQLGIRGLTYCTHALGPIMRWFKGLSLSLTVSLSLSLTLSLSLSLCVCVSVCVCVCVQHIWACTE